MIKREDVIIDTTDPRVEALIGKEVYFGNSLGEMRISEAENKTMVFVGVSKHSNLFRSDFGYLYPMIAPMPEPETEFGVNRKDLLGDLHDIGLDVYKMEITGSTIGPATVMLEAVFKPKERNHEH